MLANITLNRHTRGTIIMKEEVVIALTSMGIITAVEVATITMAVTTRVDIEETMDVT